MPIHTEITELRAATDARRSNNQEADDNDEEVDDCYGIAIERSDVAYAPVTSEERRPFEGLICEYADIFAEDIEKLSATTAATHSIDTGDHAPIRLRPYRVPQAMQSQIKNEISKMIEGGIIEPAESPWCAPLVPVVKKDGQLRLCVDYRRLNAITRKDSYPLPLIDEILDALGGCQVYSTLDARSGYWQVPLATEEDKDKTAFVIPGGGHYRFKVMPFGLCNASSTFQRMMEKVFAEHLWQFVIVFIDDIIIHSQGLLEHLQHLCQAFDCCRRYNVQLKPSKCFIAYRELEYLGFKLSSAGIQAAPRKVDAIRNAPVPTNAKEVKSFIGLASYYRRFVPHFVHIARPLNELVKKNLE
jgi:hypothetical protein